MIPKFSKSSLFYSKNGRFQIWVLDEFKLLSFGRHWYQNYWRRILRIGNLTFCFTTDYSFPGDGYRSRILPKFDINIPMPEIMSPKEKENLLKLCEEIVSQKPMDIRMLPAMENAVLSEERNKNGI